MRQFQLLCIVALTAVVAGCGGMNFKRSSGAFKYRALPVGTVVKLVESAATLPQPTATIGNLKWQVQTKTEPEANMARAGERFKKHAARYGCDAVVGSKCTTTQKKSFKKIKKMGMDGKYVYGQREVTMYTHIYTAQCVRTMMAPGGLMQSSAATAEPTAATTVTARPTAGLPSTTSKAAPAGDARSEKDLSVRAVWQALKPYDKNLLKNWKTALRAPPSSAYDVLAAFTELMVQVSGPTGIWRKTVPNDWFGCPTNPDQEQCKKLTAATAEFKPWDGLQRSMERQTPGSARGWIRRNRRRLMGYLKRYVPSSPNLTGLQQTPLYMDKVR